MSSPSQYPKLYARLLENIGSVVIEINPTENVISLYEQANKIRIENGIFDGRNYNYYLTSQFYLKRKQYSILNKQYSKEEYEKLRAHIIEDMKKNPYVDSLGRVYTYGEFFSPGFRRST